MLLQEMKFENNFYIFFSLFPVDLKPPVPNGGNKNMKFVVSSVVSVLCLILIILGILWWKGYFVHKPSREQGTLLNFNIQFYTFK